MSLSRRCEQRFSVISRSRGDDYWVRGLVQIAEIWDTGASGYVQGTAGRQYEVELDWIEAGEGRLSVDCECPHCQSGNLCKHIWAFLRAVDQGGRSRAIPGDGPLELEIMSLGDDLWDGFPTSANEHPGEDEEVGPRRASERSWSSPLRIVDARLDPPHQRPGLAGAESRRSGRTAWRRDMEALSSGLIDSRVAAASATRARAQPGEVWYVINLPATEHTGRLTVEFYQRTVKKNGTLGKLKGLKLSEADLAAWPESSDRELLGLLLGNETGSDGYAYNRWYRPSGVRQTILRAQVLSAILPRLCATERHALAESPWDLPEEPAILRWDEGPPWEFDLEISRAPEGGEWLLHGHLRREETSVDLTRITLLLREGFLIIDSVWSRWEGRGLVPWIAYLQKHGPVRVPDAEVDEFMELLWRMPGPLPVRVPPEIPWTQPRVDPVPHMMIYQPPNPQLDMRARMMVDYGEYQADPYDPTGGIVDRENRSVLVRDFERESLWKKEAVAAGFNAPDANAPAWEAMERRYRVLGRSPGRRAGTGSLRIGGAKASVAGAGATNADSSFNPSPYDFFLKPGRLSTTVRTLVASGWIVEAEGRRIRRPGGSSMSVRSGTDWFDLDAKIDFEGEPVALPALLRALQRGESFVVLGDGSQGMLPDEWLAQYGQLADFGQVVGDALRFRPSQAMLLDAFLAAQPEVEIDETFDRIRTRLSSFDGIQPATAPRQFKGRLREYQAIGLGWLHFLREFGLGGCLADDMGLGKTIQVLALLEDRREGASSGEGIAAKRNAAKGRIMADARPHRPSLVVAPRSVIFNWIEEARRFTPELRVLDYTGLGRREVRERLDAYDLVLTTYGTLRRDIGSLKDLVFDYAILDEAQAIKNAGSQAAKACRLIQAHHRLALTGTPVENHLGELWSILEFLNPGMLGRASVFKNIASLGRGPAADSPGSTANAQGNGGGNGALVSLARALRPFILRRTKERVLTELPEKSEQTLICEMESKQRTLYQELRDHYRDSLSKRIERDGIARSQIHVLEALLRLRQAACHPGLLDPARVHEPSAKLEALLAQIEEILAERHKALIFSQFVSLLSIVRTELDRKGVTYEYLDGSTRDRQKPVERFQTDPECQLFLISIKAGGQGLNLTAADYVFILDPWWNPAVEAQAVDRAHRIGQTRPVFAYRLICRDTVEEKILELQRSKSRLAEAIISEDNGLTRNLTEEDLRLLLS